MGRILSRHGIPVEISNVQFHESGSALRKIFNHILKVLFLRSQWKALPINKNPQPAVPEFIPTSFYRIFRRWTAEAP
jgi:hypothetical protein